MIFSRKLARWAALALLLRAGIDLFVADFSVASTFAKADTVSGSALIDSVEKPSTPGDPGDADDHDDDCFCCCSHVVTSPVVKLGPLEARSVAVPVADIPEPDMEPSRIFHPPKA